MYMYMYMYMYVHFLLVVNVVSFDEWYMYTYCTSLPPQQSATV